MSKKLNLGNDLYIKGRIGWRGLSKDEYVEESNYKIINATSLIDGFIDWDNCGYISEERYLESEEIMLKEGDILISKDGTLGKIGYVKGLTTPATVASGIFVLRNTMPDELNFDYLYHLLKSNIFKNFIERHKATGSTINHLYQRDLANFEIELPPLETQNKIAQILNQLDEKIAINKRINLEIEKVINTIYFYWFVQFEFPNEKGKPFKSSGGKMIYCDKMKRDIPDGWNVQSLDESIELIIDHRGKTPKKLGGDWVKDGIIALSAKIVKDGRLINIDNANKVSPEMYERWMPIKLEEGDILMTSEAPLGEFYFILIDTEYCLSQRLFAIRANKKYVLPTYLYQELSIGHGYSQIIGSQSGSTVFGIRQDELRKINIVVPDKEIQQNYEKITLPLLSKKRILEKEIQELIKTRNFLLPLLMNGQVTLKKS